MKLEEKIRVGSKVKKKYDRPMTPYQRVLEASLVEKESWENKVRLNQEYAKLNPAELRRQITTLQIKLRKLSVKENLKKEGLIRIITMKKLTQISSIFLVRQRIKLSNGFLYEAIVVSI
jgi:hypothetical protein